MTQKNAHGAIAGILLAGGQSRRMFEGEGGDKGLLAIGGRPMIVHVMDRLRPQVAAMALNANGDPARFASLGLPVVADSVGGFVGPLAGVLAGMRWAAAQPQNFTHILTVSTDAPFLPADLVARLAEGLATAPIALAASGGEVHPVIGLWPVVLADDLERALNAGVRKVLAWTDRHGTTKIEFQFLSAGGRMVDPFFNANTRADLDEARELLALMPPQRTA